MAPRVRTIALACCIGWLALACAAPPPAPAPTPTLAPVAPAAPPTAVATATAPAVPTATPAPAAPTLVPAPQQTAAPRALACGDTISRSVVLTTDLTCSGDALIVQASDITIDLGGHTITGPGAGSPTWPQPNLASSGVKISGQRGVTLKNGSFKSFSSAVFLDNTTDSHIEAIDARANYYGIYLKSATNNEVSRSTFRGNIYGLTLYQSHKNTLAENDSSAQTHFSPGGYGIYMYSSNDNMVVGNTFKQNDNWGIWLSDSKNNVFYHNNIISNHPQVSDDSGGNIWHDAQAREGNYWADWEGRELAGTGIGNHPYLIQGPGGATDAYPFVRENGWSQARQRAPELTATPVPTRSAGGGGLFLSVPDLNQVASVSGSSLRALRTLGRLASNLALSADGNVLYVVDAATLLALDSATGAVLRTYPVDTAGRTVYIALDRDGQTLHLLDGTRVTTLDLTSGEVAQQVPYAAEPSGVFPSWKHRLLLVADGGGSSVDVVWVGGGKVTYRIPVVGSPTALTANRAGTRLYTAIPGAPSVSIIETEQYAVIDHIGDNLAAQLDVATSPDASRLYVLLASDSVIAYDLLTRAAMFTASTPVGAAHVLVSGDALLVAGASNGTGWLARLDANTGRLLSRMELPGAPRDLLARP